ncbi:hypothetical protein V8D89_000446 [Ganoderma adspersum]
MPQYAFDSRRNTVPAAICETYATERRLFKVRVLIVVPGSFLTEGVRSHLPIIATHIPA